MGINYKELSKKFTLELNKFTKKQLLNWLNKDMKKL